MNTRIIYEQPLSERVRSFLRIEHLFNQVEYFIKGTSEWENRQTLVLLIEIVDFLSRSDLKSELMKELERHANTLAGLNGSPGVDANRLRAILDNINTNLYTLRDTGCQPGQCLRQDEFITTIKQRIAIPGGTCNFDLPNYNFWLHRSPEERAQQINYWLNDLLIIRDSINLCLQMIRNSTNPVYKQAETGFYQQIIESNVACQLIRVLLPAEAACYPEISGGKHRFTIRFLEQPRTSIRPVQTKAAVDFELHCCIL
ncbi:MAG TPA: cell division protein ZapD [Gammaproteobacteria bacterium]|nr:cell division protein ZapD [Gammaproteobacteria bacterium]